ncbi:membrane protein required for colicin V production [Parabacteroides sp. PFB2-10]|uniref:CvpA family protein n=1 Tax=Parabacteroides sp. PFB2-10 TaxID=1742405 RepID=UPI0024744635|nr:CvpA family protein [Parabacteroides sp. PFB2-10]MDH6311496.1 membrane protein required for colicin V production [Parabacteroides sp. PFB2-10]
MNWLDIVILCLAGVGIVKGLFDGIIKQVVSLIALVAGIFFCGKAAQWLRGYIIDLDWFPPEGVSIISYVLGFFLIVGIVLLAGEIVNRVVGVTPLSIINHLLGGVFGLLVMILFISLFFNLLEAIDSGSVLIRMQTKLDSRFYYTIKEILPTIFPSNLFYVGQ